VLLFQDVLLCFVTRFDEAERLLQEAVSKSSNDPTSMANLITCMHHLRKSVEANRYTAQLKAMAPTHPWVAKHTELENSFARCASQFSK